MAKYRPPMRITLSLLAGSFLFAFGAAACGGSTSDQTDAGDDGGGDETAVEADIDAGPDVDNGAPSDTYPAFKVDAPQVVDLGGSVLAAPDIVPVYFNNDDTTFTGNLTTFMNKLPASTFWPGAVSEYNVGAITIEAPVQLTEDAPQSIADSAIQTWLAGKLGSDPAFPAPNANSIYALFYPTGTTITLGQGGGTSCSSFGAYHGNITYNSNKVAYAVMPRCASFGGLSGLDAVTAPTSHELVEAATDPYGSTYAQLDDNHIIWEFILGGAEIGDLCAQNQASFYKPVDLNVHVQRAWSNAKAKGEHDPCQPGDGTPYFNSVPVLSENIDVLGQVTTMGVTIPVGQTKTIEVDLFSDAATSGVWTVGAIDSATLQGQAAELQFAWDRKTGRNGEKLHLSITVKTASQYNAEAFVITSTLGARQNTWIGLVGN